MKVAVIIPVYNASAFLPQTLDSILAQTYPGVEVWCCDDGSTDAAPQVLADYAQRNPGRVHVSGWANHGVGPTLNRLMDELSAETDAFAICDCDDYLHPKFIETLVAAMEKTGADVVECDVARVPSTAIYPNDLPSGGSGEVRVIEDMSVFRLKRTAPGRWINYWNKLYRRSSVAGVRFRQGLDYEDDYFFEYEVNAAIARKALVDRPLYAYRMNPEGVTSRVRFGQYVDSSTLRVRLSLEVFLNAGRIPPEMCDDFRRELAKDAYRMCIRKNLKKNKDAALRRELFCRAGDRFAELEASFGFRPVGLNPLQHLLYWCCRHRHYVPARLLSVLT